MAAPIRSRSVFEGGGNVSDDGGGGGAPFVLRRVIWCPDGGGHDSSSHREQEDEEGLVPGGGHGFRGSGEGSEQEALRATPRGSPAGDALAAAAEARDLRGAGPVGGGQHPAAAQARGELLAAAGLPARRVLRGVRRRGPRAPRPRRGDPRRPPGVPRRRHGHRGGAPHVPDHAQHPRRRRPRRDRREPHQLGRLDPGLDRRGEPPRRPHEQVPLPHRQGRHAPDREDHPVPHRLRNGSEDGDEPVPGVHLHVVPGAGDLHLARQHGAAGAAARRRGAGAGVRRHRGRRAAARDGVRADRREALRGGPGLHGAGLRRHDAQEGGHAGAPHDRRPGRRAALRALQRRRAADRGVHGEGLRRHHRVPRPAVGRRRPHGAVRGRAPRAGVRVLAGAEVQEARGEGARQGKQGRAVRAIQLDLRPTSSALTDNSLSVSD